MIENNDRAIKARDSLIGRGFQPHGSLSACHLVEDDRGAARIFVLLRGDEALVDCHVRPKHSRFLVPLATELVRPLEEVEEVLSGLYEANQFRHWFLR